MYHEVIVEGFVLEVEVTRLENDPPCPGSWNSDWGAMGTRELEFKVLSGVTYDKDGVRIGVDHLALPLVSMKYGRQIEVALWVEIDAATRRARWAA